MNILLYDLEISPALAWVYEMYDANVIRVERPAYIMCFAYKFYGTNRVHAVAQPDFDMYEDQPYNDYMVVYKLHQLMDMADIVVAHNANKFDNKIAMSRFLMHGMNPPSPYKTVDTLTAARRLFRMGKNSLDYLCEQLELGHKPDVTHAKLWHGCVEGDEKSWRLMKQYCKHDVELLDGLYKNLLPFISNHPNVAILGGRIDACPKCGGTHMHSRGKAHTNVATYRRWQCQDCGGWHRERIQDRDSGKPTYVNA